MLKPLKSPKCLSETSIWELKLRFLAYLKLRPPWFSEIAGRWWFKMMLSSLQRQTTKFSNLSLNLVPSRKMSTLQQTHRPLISKPLAHVGVPTSEAIPLPWTSSLTSSVAREIWSDPSSRSFQALQIDYESESKWSISKFPAWQWT